MKRARTPPPLPLGGGVRKEGVWQMPFSISACSEDTPVLPPLPSHTLATSSWFTSRLLFFKGNPSHQNHPLFLSRSICLRKWMNGQQEGQSTFFYFAVVLLKDEAGLMGHKTIRFFKNAMGCWEFRGWLLRELSSTKKDPHIACQFWSGENWSNKQKEAGYKKVAWFWFRGIPHPEENVFDEMLFCKKKHFSTREHFVELGRKTVFWYYWSWHLIT